MEKSDSGLLDGVESRPVLGIHIGSSGCAVAVAQDGKVQALAAPDGGAMVQMSTYGGELTVKLEDALKMVKETVKSRLGVEIKEAVLSVAAYLTEDQRQSTKDACVAAGLTVLHVLNSPIAAVIGLGLDAPSSSSEVLVCYAGSTSTHVSLVSPGAAQILAMSYDLSIGGNSINDKIYETALEGFAKRYSLNAPKNAKATGRLQREVERAKKCLSTNMVAQIEIEYFVDDKELSEEINRPKLDFLARQIIIDMVGLTKSVAAETKGYKSAAELQESEFAQFKTRVDKVVLAGGTARVPRLRERMQDMFGETKMVQVKDPIHIAACGAAVRAAEHSGQERPKIASDV